MRRDEKLIFTEVHTAVHICASYFCFEFVGWLSYFVVLYHRLVFGSQLIISVARIFGACTIGHRFRFAPHSQVHEIHTNMNPNILHWSYRDFHELPAELVEHRDNLEEIYLKENFISTLPLWLFEFSHLKFIHLSGNLLKSLPDEICYLDNLEYLNVSKNQIAALPKTMSKLRKLQYLNASENVIECIGAEIGLLPALETLDLCRNRLQEVPVQLADSTTLCGLFLSENNLCEIPTKIMSMPQLKVFEAESKSFNFITYGSYWIYFSCETVAPAVLCSL